MSKYIISVGHTASGNIGSGASDLLDESNCTREIAPLVCTYLQKKGHEVHLLRIDKSNSYNCEDCYVRADQANSIGGDLFVEIHLNSGKERTGDGAEVCVNSATGNTAVIAQRVVNKLATLLNIDNRGLREEKLIVLRRTDMPAILVECMFVDTNNINNYKPEVIAKAIAEGILGEDIIEEWQLGWNQRGTRWFYCTDLNTKSYYASCWKLIDGFWYLFDSQGWCFTGWTSYINQSDKKEVWYYLDPISCKMATGWKQINSKWYYFNTDGSMATSWIKDNGKDYCLYSDGSMIHDTTAYGYRFDSNGVATKL